MLVGSLLEKEAYPEISRHVLYCLINSSKRSGRPLIVYYDLLYTYVRVSFTITVMMLMLMSMTSKMKKQNEKNKYIIDYVSLRPSDFI